MSATIKDQKAILNKLGIETLNPMQQAAHLAITEHPEVILLSPTGTGKTLAFLLPIIAALDPAVEGIQVLILVPSRELAIQIEQVIREMGSGYKANAIYGGRSGFKDRVDLKHAPAILVGTPGRIADHIRRGTISTENIQTLVLDEFDKSLEVGFESEMTEIVTSLRYLEKKILTSATQKAEVPEFIGLRNPKKLNYLDQAKSQLEIRRFVSPDAEKLEMLVHLIGHLGEQNGIIFCSLKDTIQEVSDFLEERHIGHACFYGGLEQMDRERSLIKFRNGTQRILIATDLAARGIDVPELDFIIHYELPFKKEEFTHRNGRTARMNSNGTAYILHGKKEKLPDFAEGTEAIDIRKDQIPVESPWETLHISGGRKDKISKGDIAGLFFKQGALEKHELGIIELIQDCAYVAVAKEKVRPLVKSLNNVRLKSKKVRITLLY